MELEENIFEQLIAYASRMFDLECGVVPEYFEAAVSSAAVSNKTVYGDGTNFLKLPPYVPGTLNTTLTYPEGYSALDFRERDGYLVRSSDTGVLAARSCGGGWPEAVPIVISARWGYSATPADVQMAVSELAINIWRETDPASLKLVSIDNQPLREKIPPRVARIASHYRVRQGTFV